MRGVPEANRPEKMKIPCSLRNAMMGAMHLVKTLGAVERLNGRDLNW